MAPPRRKSKKPVVSRRGRRRSRTSEVTRRSTKNRKPEKKRRHNTQSQSQASTNPSKRVKRSTTKVASLPYRSPTPPKERPPNYKKYGGLKPVIVEDDEDEPMSGVESGDGEEEEEEGEEYVRSHRAPSTVNRDRDRICHVCGRRHLPKSILKRRDGAYPKPRQGGRRAKRKVRFLNQVLVKKTA